MGKHQKKSLNTEIFKLFISMPPQDVSLDNAKTLKELLRDIYQKNGYELFLEEDIAALEREGINSIEEVKEAILIVDSAPLHLHLVSWDIIRYSLMVSGDKYKKAFKVLHPSNTTTIEHWPESMEPHTGDLMAHRLVSPKILGMLSKQTWKSLALTMSLRVAITKMMTMRTSQLETHSQADRMTVFSAGNRTFEVDRYCPHKNFDMLNVPVVGDILTCPKHGWQFDLSRGGKCLNGKFPCSINAVSLDW